MAKRKYPEYNVLYTFKHDKNGKETYQTLLFKGELPNGRLSFLNVNYKNYTDMKPERFSYLYRWNFKSEKPVYVQNKIKLDPVKPTEIAPKITPTLATSEVVATSAHQSKEEESALNYWRNAVANVESLSLTSQKTVEQLINEPYKKFLKEFKNAVEDPKSTSSTFGTYCVKLAPFFKWSLI